MARTAPPRILIAEDEDRLRRVFDMLLSGAGYQISLAEDGEAAWSDFQSEPPDVVITDLRMPKLGGMDLLKRIKCDRPETPVIVVTAFGAVDSAVEAMKAGAADFLTKPVEEEKLRLAIQKALEWREIVSENLRLRAASRKQYDFSAIIATSKAMRETLQLAGQVAMSDATALIYGESGTGKELVARAIHINSRRSRSPFEAVNCAAIPENLLESELFGYDRGAFTGAVDSKPGMFELASGGTLFLDEIGDMAPTLQAKVLRALEDQTFKRLGGSKTVQTDARLVAATNRDIARMVRESTFREDLFYRLSVFPIEIKPLRERTDDIIPLTRHFLQRFCRQMGRPVPEIAPEAEKFLLSHPWPGNVRELQNAIERATILLQGPMLTPEILGRRPGAAESPGLAGTEKRDEFTMPADGFDLEKHVGTLVEQAMRRSGGNKSAAAKMLGISRATLRYRLEKYGVEGEHEAQ